MEMASDRKHALGTVTDEIATTIDGNGRKEGGGHDNLTLAIIETNINSKLRSKMNAKTKILLGAVSLICLLSLVFNGILLSRSKSSASEDTITAQAQVDSLKSVISRMDTVITKQQREIHVAQSTAVSSNDELQSKVKRLESKVSDLNMQISKKNEENKKLREEIDQLKKEKSSGDKSNKR